MALAIYQREWTPTEISNSFSVSNAQAPVLKSADDDRMMARYTFAEALEK